MKHLGRMCVNNVWPDSRRARFKAIRLFVENMCTVYLVLVQEQTQRSDTLPELG